MSPVGFTDFVNVGDVGMAEGGGGFCLQYESPEPVFVGNELGQQQLERDLAIQAGVFGQVDFTHAARAELLKYPIVCNGLFKHEHPSSF